MVYCDDTCVLGVLGPTQYTRMKNVADATEIDYIFLFACGVYVCVCVCVCACACVCVCVRACVRCMYLCTIQYLYKVLVHIGTYVHMYKVLVYYCVCTTTTSMYKWIFPTIEYK